MKKILSIALACVMVVSLFAVNVFAATGNYVEKSNTYLDEKFQGEAPYKLGNVEVSDGVATLLTSRGSAPIKAKTNIDLPSKFILEFDLACPEGTEAYLVFADSDNEGEKRYSVYIQPDAYEAGKDYTYKFIIDQSQLILDGAANNYKAIEYYRKEVGTDEWVKGVYYRNGASGQWAKDENNNNIVYPAGAPAIRYSGADWLSNSICAKAMCFYMYNDTTGLATTIDNVKIYETYEELVSVTEYVAKEDFEGEEYLLDGFTVTDGVASLANSTSAAAIKPVVANPFEGKYVFEFDMECSLATAEPYFLFKNTANAADPYFALQLAGGTFEADKNYTYKFIIDPAKLESGVNNYKAVEYYRKEVGTDEWVKGVYAKSGTVGKWALNEEGNDITYVAGTPAVRYLGSSAYAKDIADKTVGFWLWSSATTPSTLKIDNVKLSKTGYVNVSEIVNDGEKIGAKVEFDDADAIDLSTQRSAFLALYNGERLVAVDMNKVDAENGLYTAELAVDKADYDEAKIFVWETADNTPALPEVFDLTAWIAE